MPDADDIATPDEQVGLAEGNPTVDHLRRPRHDEQGIAILLDLGNLVRAFGVLDGKRVQIELALHAPEQVDLRLVKSDPHDVVGLAGPFARLVERNVDLAAAFAVHDRIDQAWFQRTCRQLHTVRSCGRRDLVHHCSFSPIEPRACRFRRLV